MKSSEEGAALFRLGESSFGYEMRGNGEESSIVLS